VGSSFPRGTMPLKKCKPCFFFLAMFAGGCGGRYPRSEVTMPLRSSAVHIRVTFAPFNNPLLRAHTQIKIGPEGVFNTNVVRLALISPVCVVPTENTTLVFFDKGALPTGRSLAHIQGVVWKPIEMSRENSLAWTRTVVRAWKSDRNLTETEGSQACRLVMPGTTSWGN
jgi:hypothetical protein